MKLFFAPRTRSIRARWLLEELEVPYEVVKVDLASPDAVKALRDVSPLGALPALVDGNLTLFESSSICLYLAEKYAAKGFLPATVEERGEHAQWLIFAETAVESAVMPFYGNPSHSEDEKQRLRARLDEVFAVVEARLKGRQQLVGDKFSAADIVMASILHLAHHLKLLEGHPALFDYTLRQVQRPAVRRAMA